MPGKWVHLWGVLSVVGLAVGIALTVVALSSSANATTTHTEFTDKAGRHCTQVGAALDCDYPPAENRIGDALNGLVNP